jgi:hypothetical protein
MVVATKGSAGTVITVPPKIGPPGFTDAVVVFLHEVGQVKSINVSRILGMLHIWVLISQEMNSL